MSRCRGAITVKGYEFSKNRYVIVTDEDMEAVKVESSGMMTIEKFVAAESIDPIYYDASYYLAPDGKAGEDVYAVLMEAIEKTGRVAEWSSLNVSAPSPYVQWPAAWSRIRSTSSAI